MRKLLASLALCALALSAGAQPAAPAHAQPAPQGKGAGWISTASAGTAEARLAQGTRNGLMNAAAQDATGRPPVDARTAQHKQDPAPEQEHRRRTGPAMLLAALAVMTAIALRRLGATDT